MAAKTACATGRPQMTPAALARMMARPRCSGGTRAAVVTSCQASSSARAASARERRWAASRVGRRDSGIGAKDNVTLPALFRRREVGAIVGAAALFPQQGSLRGEAGDGEEVGQLVGGAVSGWGNLGPPRPEGCP